jgi:serine/threonine-protein kinase
MNDKRLCHAHLRERIGKGGLGVVYKAYHPEFGLCAVKFVQPEMHNLPGVGDNFQREIENQKYIATRSPYTISVLESGYLDGIPYVVMPFLPYSLESIVHAGTWQELTELGFNQYSDFVLWLLHGLAIAVADLHKYAVHGDLKPSNILLNPHSDNLVRLSDFGTLKVTTGTLLGEKTDTADTSMSSISLAGTYLYMAPEQFEGSDPTKASDMFAFGVIAWQLIYNQLPFPWIENDTVVSYARRKSVQPPFPPYRTEIPDPVRQVLMSALRIDPLRRIRSTTRFVAEIERAWKSPSQFYFRDPPAVKVYVLLGYATLLLISLLFLAQFASLLAD